MKENLKIKILYWLPRVLSILFILFISMFALDVFSEYNFPLVLVALFMHLIPTFILIGITILAWKKPKIGGWLYIALGLVYIFLAWGKFDFLTLLIISGPLFLTGILFLLNKELR